MDEQLFVPTNPSPTAPPPSQIPPVAQSVTSNPPPPPPPPVSAPPKPPPPPQSASYINPPTKGSPLKGILIGLFALIFLSLIGFGVYTFIKNRQSGQVKTLTYWGLWEPDAVMRPILDEYEAAHKDVKIEYKYQSLREYRERLSSALSQGKGPDIFRIHNSWVPMFKSDLSSVPASVYSAADFENTFYPSVRDTLRVGTNYVAVPLEYDGLAMYINTKIFQENGLNPPTTWDELRQAALIMSRCETDTGACKRGDKILVSGVALGTANNVDHWQDVISVLLMQNNVSLSNPTGQPASDVFSFYRNFTTSYAIWDSSLPNSTNQFAAGKVGIYFGPSWRVFDLKAINPNLQYAIYPIPQLPVDPSRGEKPVNWASFWAEAVNSKSQNTSAAWDLVKYLSSSEVLEKIHQASIANGRDFGEPYSRVDMANKLASNDRVKPFLDQAPLARSWYIASSTLDGNNGINTKLSQAFADVIDQKIDVTALPTQISAILTLYGLSASAQ